MMGDIFAGATEVVGEAYVDGVMFGKSTGGSRLSGAC